MANEQASGGRPVASWRELAEPGTASRRTNADKRRDVLPMLDGEPGLSDPEIGRRCGVSPQKVGNWRRRQA